MKRFLLLLIFVLLAKSSFAALPCTEGTATCWIVRGDGGTTTQCNGHYNAAYDGSGTGENCALSHPAWALGGVNTSTVMAAGDTLYIAYYANGYEIGYDMPNTLGCNLSYPYDCILDTIPNGIDIDNRTKIYGEGWDTGCPDSTKPSLWGADRVGRVLKIGSNNDIRCLEITDHSGCMFRQPGNVQSGSKIDNEPTQDPIICAENHPNRVGDYAINGIQMDNVDNINIQDVYLHGIGNRCVYACALGGSITLTDVKMEGCPGSGWDADCGTSVNYDAGTTVEWTRTTLQWSGCGERYSATPGGYGVNTPHNCCSQDQTCYGDGIGFAGDSGDWTFTDTNISNNTSDGIDLLYSSTGNVKLFRHKAEGNAGASFKCSNPSAIVENSILLDNCASWSKSPNVYGSQYSPGRSGTTCDHDSSCDSNENYQNCSDCVGFNTCRASSNISFSLGSNKALSIYNSTLFSTHDVNILASNDSNCGTGSTVTYKNNIIYGAEEYNAPGDRPDAYYCYCPGSGSCPPVTQTNNTCYNGKEDVADCAGGSIANPNLVGPIKTTSADPHVGTSFWNNFKLTLSSSNEIGGSAADETVVLQGTSNDVSNAARGSDWDRGAWEYAVGGTTRFLKSIIIF